MNWCVVLQIFIGALLSALLAAGFVMLVEFWRKPRLSLRIRENRTTIYKDNVIRPATTLRTCKLYLENHNLPKRLRWMSRNAAVHCRGYITFHKGNGDYAIKNPMPIKWSEIPRLEASRTGKPIERTLYEVSYMDVHPGEKSSLDVVARFDSDSECYGWNNESYYSEPPWRNPYWRIEGPEDYFIKVKIISAGIRCEDVFKLHIGKNPDDFKLEKVEKIDKERILKVPELSEEDL